MNKDRNSVERGEGKGRGEARVNIRGRQKGTCKGPEAGELGRKPVRMAHGRWRL